jgi:IclR family acetate operon transcriptional repressor
LAVLELLAADGPLTLAEIQRRGALNKTMTFRLVRVLRELGYVDRDPEAHRYSLALKLHRLGEAAAPRLDIIAAGQPRLDALRQVFGETTNLGVIDEGQIVYVAMAESSRPGLRMASHVGGRGGLHSTAMGKAMLAFLPEAEREALLAGVELMPVTPKTIVNLDELREELTRTRRRGHAIDNEENEIGARCVGVPILDANGRPLAAISISGPAGRIDEAALGAIADRLWSASREISARLGHEIAATSLGARTGRAGEEASRQDARH